MGLLSILALDYHVQTEQYIAENYIKFKTLGFPKSSFLYQKLMMKKEESSLAFSQTVCLLIGKVLIMNLSVLVHDDSMGS